MDFEKGAMHIINTMVVPLKYVCRMILLFKFLKGSLNFWYILFCAFHFQLAIWLIGINWNYHSCNSKFCVCWQNCIVYFTTMEYSVWHFLYNS